MADKGNDATKAKWLYWMDNLRTVIIFLVILYHAGGVYESGGIWALFWLVDDPATSILPGIVNIMLDIFLMPTLFLISGYLAPMSVDRKTGWAFLGSRFKRLILPWFFAVLLLMPLYKVIFLYSRNLPQEHWTTYFHFSKETITSQNWLWFLPVLFLFNLLYLLLAKTKIRINISVKGAAAAIFALGLVSSLVVGYFVGFRVWIKTPFIDFEADRLIMYFLIFLFGVLCFRKQAFAEKPKRQTLYIIVCCIAWIPVTIHIFARLIPFMTGGGALISPTVDWLIWWLSFYLSLLCMLYLMIETFWRYLDRTGPVWKELNKNSYGVYIIHVIVLGLIALLLLNTSLPSLVKYITLAVSTFLVCNLIVGLGRRLVQAIRSSISKPETAAAKAE